MYLDVSKTKLSPLSINEFDILCTVSLNVVNMWTHRLKMLYLKTDLKD